MVSPRERCGESLPGRSEEAEQGRGEDEHERTDPDIVISILHHTVKSIPGVVESPAPEVVFRGYDGGDLCFSLLFWSRVETSLGVLSEVGLAVHPALEAEGIEIAMPNRDVRIRGSLTADSVLPTDSPDRLPDADSKPREK